MDLWPLNIRTKTTAKDNTTKKQAKDLNRQFSKEDTLVAKMNMIRDIQHNS